MGCTYNRDQSSICAGGNVHRAREGQCGHHRMGHVVQEACSRGVIILFCGQKQVLVFLLDYWKEVELWHLMVFNDLKTS